ncbi:MAG: MFS transporter [Candidatus Dormibacteraceae bacterium]
MGPRAFLVDVGPVRESRPFRFLLIAMVTSLCGRQVLNVAVPFQVFILTRSSLAVGLVSAARLLPMLTAGLYGGLLVDRYDRRQVMFFNKVASAGCSVGLVGVALLPHPPLVPIVVLAALGAGLGNIESACKMSIPPRLFPAQRLAAASSLQQLTTQVGVVVGPAVGGLVIGLFGLPWAYSLDVILALPALAAIAAMPSFPPHDSSPQWSLRVPLQAVGFAARTPLVKASFLIDIVAMLFGAPTALFPAMAVMVYHVGPAGLGLLYSAIGLGGLLGSVLTGWVSGVERRGLAVTASVLCWGAAITGFGLAAPLFAVGLLFLALAGAADVISAIFRTTIIQTLTPDRLRGRIGSLNSLVVVSGPSLGDLESGGVATLTSPVIAVVFGGLACLAGALLLVAAIPELRSGRLSDARPSGAGTAPPELELEPPA